MYDNLLFQASREIQDKLLNPEPIFQSNPTLGGKHNCSTPDPGFTGGELYKHLGPTLLLLSLPTDPVAVYQPSANLYSQFSSVGSDQRDQGIYGIRRSCGTSLST